MADRRASVSFPYDMDSQRPPANNPVVADVKTFEWDEESIDQWISPPPHLGSLAAGLTPCTGTTV